MPLPEVSKLVLDAYLAYVRYQKLCNVFYTVPWLTISLLFPMVGESPIILKAAPTATNTVFCHDRIIDTLYAIALTLKDLKVLDGDSVDQVNAFLGARLTSCSFFVKIPANKTDSTKRA